MNSKAAHMPQLNSKFRSRTEELDHTTYIFVDIQRVNILLRTSRLYGFSCRTPNIIGYIECLPPKITSCDVM